MDNCNYLDKLVNFVLLKFVNWRDKLARVKIDNKRLNPVV